jgi:hypothetical protein
MGRMVREGSLTLFHFIDSVGLVGLFFRGKGKLSFQSNLYTLFKIQKYLGLLISPVFLI